LSMAYSAAFIDFSEPSIAINILKNVLLSVDIFSSVIDMQNHWYILFSLIHINIFLVYSCSFAILDNISSTATPKIFSIVMIPLKNNNLNYNIVFEFNYIYQVLLNFPFNCFPIFYI